MDEDLFELDEEESRKKIADREAEHSALNNFDVGYQGALVERL